MRLAVLAAGSLLAAAPALAEPFEETFSLSGSSLYVEDLIGAVRIERAPGSSFEVRVSVQGKDASRDRIHIERKGGDAAGLRVVFPIEDESRFVYPRLGARSKSTFQWNPDRDPAERRSFWREVFNLGPGKRVTISGKGSGLEIWADLTILVPANRRLDLKLGVGSAEAVGVDGDLNLDTASGSVQAERLSGKVSIDTGSGEVILQGMKGNAVIDTGSGQVTAHDVDGDLHVDTGSGEVEIARARGGRSWPTRVPAG